MSFDPFETRLQFLQLLKKLNASQPSIQKVVAFALRYGSRCGEDLWECIAEECGKGSLNTRINIFYLLDSLAEASLGVGPSDAPYVRCMARDLGRVVESVVPPTKEGVLNLKAIKQILDSWRTRRILDPSVIDPVNDHLENRSIDLSSPKKRDHSEAFSRADILRRMEEDRERHKRLRERMWILPVPPLTQQQPSSASAPAKPRQPLGTNATASPLSTSPFTPASPSTAGQQASRTALGSTGTKGGTMAPPPVPQPQPQEKDRDRGHAALPTGDSALDVEFEQMWVAAVPLENEDFQRMRDDAKQAGIRIPI